MSVIERLKTGAENLKQVLSGDGNPEKVRSVKASEAKNINEDLDAARGYSDSKAVSEAKKRKRMEKAVEDKKQVNVSKELREEREQLANEIFEDAISLRGVFQYLMNNPEDVKVRSKDYKGEFGYFHDVWITTNGLMAAIKRDPETGETQPVCTGRTIKDVFRNYGSLGSMVKDGTVLVNLDKEGNYVSNMMDEEAPLVAIDDNGNIVTSQTVTEPLIKQLAQKEQRAQQMAQEAKQAEKSWMRERQEKVISDMAQEVSESRASSAETELSKSVDSFNKIRRKYDDRMDENMRLQQQKRIAESLVQVNERARDKVLRKYEKWFDKRDIDMARDDIENMLNWAGREFGGSPVNKQPQESGTQDE